MALIDSLLTAMVRADGDALVLHVGERPYVVAHTGALDLSTQTLNLDAMTGMLQQLLPRAAQSSLEEFGAVEHRLASSHADAFTVVAARGGDDIWIEIRRRRSPLAAAAVPVAASPVAPPAVEPQLVTPAIAEPTVEVTIAEIELSEFASASPPVAGPEPVEVPLLEAPDLASVDDLPATEPVVLPATEPVVVEEPMVARVEDAPPPSEPRRDFGTAPTREPAPDTSEMATVIPMTRTVRNEVPPRAAPMRAGVERLLRMAVSRGASALFLTTDAQPSIRVEGDVRSLDSEPVLTSADVQAVVMEIVPAAEQEAVGRGESTEWITELADLGRIRCVTFTDHRGPGVVFRMIATRAATAEQLGLSREVQALATEPQGLVLVAGSRGTGKSTLVSALVDLVNRQRAEYVVTLERQIRLVHDNRAAIVSQREVRGGPEEAVTAARAALRENPDVLVVDDLLSSQMVPLLLDAAVEGLVLVSITSPSTIDAVERFIELAPADMRGAVHAAVADAFRGAVSQVMLKKAGGGRVAAREVLLATAPVTRAIADGVPGQLLPALEGGRKHGMVPFADAFVGLVQSGMVDVREAFRKSSDRNRLLAALKREGIDTSVVERLA